MNTKLLIILLLFPYMLFPIDQNMDQITGTESMSGKEVPANRPKETEEIKKLKEELELLKKEFRELSKNKIPSQQKEQNPILSEKVQDPFQKPLPIDTTDKYAGFSRDLFLQIQSPDFKKALADRIQWQVTFWNHGNYFNNGDLRKIDNSSLTSVERTDDKTRFVAGGLQFDAFFPVHPRLDFRFDIWRFGFWGQDQLAGRDSNNDIRQTTSGANTVNFGQLYFDWHFKLEPTRNDRISLRVGRQDFRLGGRIYRDFYQDDILDAVVFKYYSPKIGKLDILLVDVFSNAPDTKDANFVRFLSFSSPVVYNFDGKAMTIRHGIKHRYSFWGDSETVGNHLELTPFYFISYYSGSNQPFGGSDRTFQGTAGNFSDNDFTTMKGVRWNFGHSYWFRSGVTMAESVGIDRKVPTLQLENKDVDTNGKSIHLEMEFSNQSRRFRFLPSYYFSDGGKYHSDGTQYSHGFVSFKGDKVGGLLTDLYWGFRPSAYTSHQGTVDLPYTMDRKSGMQFKHFGFIIGILENLNLKLDWWRMDDTNYFANSGDIAKPSLSYLFKNRENIDLETQNIIFNEFARQYPNNSSVILAARRFGSTIAEEYNIGMDLNLYRGFKVWATWAVLIPSKYFATTGLVQNAPEGTTRFIGFQLGSSLVF